MQGTEIEAKEHTEVCDEPNISNVVTERSRSTAVGTYETPPVPGLDSALD